jgi:uncharacterized phage protein gp47/JayE
MTRDAVAGGLASVSVPKQVLLSSLNAAASIGNSVLRVMSDAMSGLALLTLKYLDWLSLQLLPDTAETVWLDRHGMIWLTNSDGTKGRKGATSAVGTVTFTGTQGVVVPSGTILIDTNAFTYQTTADVTLGTSATATPIYALDPGIQGNLPTGTVIALTNVLNGVNGSATVVQMVGGTDAETDDELRARVLQRIQEPPMGGDQADWIAWAEEVPGVTRAWCSPLEEGMGTVTVRFMMDALRADNAGIPLAEDVVTVQSWIDVKRPVAVKDYFVLAPIPFPLDVQISALVTDSVSVRAAIQQSLQNMLLVQASPGCTIYRSWVDTAISETVGEDHHESSYTTTVMPTPGHLPVLGSIIYAGS